jgi:hypothetical protein
MERKRAFIQIPILIAIIVSIVVASGIGYEAFEYHKTSKTIKESEQLTKEEKYDEAIKKLEVAQNKFLGKTILKQKINTELEKNKKLLEDKTEYMQGIEEFNKGNWERAKELLLKVSENFPHYQDAKNKIEEAEKKILEEKAAEKIKEIEERAQKEIEEEKRKITKNQLQTEGQLNQQQIPKLQQKEVKEEKILEGTKVGGIISSDTVWSSKNSPYIVAENILVDENVTLKIEPGTEIKFNQGKYIQVMGYLEAQGTKESYIKFTRNYSVDQLWEIKVGKYREGNKGGTIKLQYCTIEYGIIKTESYAYGSRDFNNLMISNCIFDTSGIYAEGPGIKSYISHNTFLNAPNVAIYINTGISNPIEISYNNFKKNKVAISIGPVSSSGVRIKNNNFYLDNYIDISTDSKDDIDVSNNWWGTTDIFVIDTKIRDFYDFFDLGKLNYQPIITSKIPSEEVVSKETDEISNTKYATVVKLTDSKGNVQFQSEYNGKNNTWPNPWPELKVGETITIKVEVNNAIADPVFYEFVGPGFPNTWQTENWVTVTIDNEIFNLETIHLRVFVKNSDNQYRAPDYDDMIQVFYKIKR